MMMTTMIWMTSKCKCTVIKFISVCTFFSNNEESSWNITCSLEWCNCIVLLPFWIPSGFSWYISLNYNLHVGVSLLLLFTQKMRFTHGVFHVIVFLYLFIYAIHVHLVFFLGLCQILTWWYRKRKRYIQTCSLYGYSKELILKCFVSSLWFLLMLHLASGVRSREWTS